MDFKTLWAASVLCICGASAGILPASTQIFLPAASPAPSFVYLDQTQQQEGITAHPPLAYQLSLAYPGSPTPSSPLATSASLTGNVLSESSASRGGNDDRITSSALERTSGIERQRGQQQVQQRQRVDYIVNEVGRREGVDGQGRPLTPQRQQISQQQIAQQQIAQQQIAHQQITQQQIAQQQAYQQQRFGQQLQQQPQKQRFGFGDNDANFGAISGIEQSEGPESGAIDLQRQGESIQGRGRTSFVADQRGSSQRQPVDSRRPDISSLTLSLQRQGHGSFSAGAARQQIPSSLSIQRQESQTEHRIAFQGVGVESEAARYQQSQREQQAAAVRVAGGAGATFEDATVRAFPSVLPTLSPTVASVTGHGLQQAHPTESGFSSYSVQFVSPQFGYGYYGDQHSLQQQSSILVRSSLDGNINPNTVGSSGGIVGKQ